MKFDWRMVGAVLVAFAAALCVAVGLTLTFMWHDWLGWTLSGILFVAFMVFVGFMDSITSALDRRRSDA